MKEITLHVNGERRTVTADVRSTLLDLLRERLHLTGTKKGCDHGLCGACTVSVDGERVVSCLTLAASIDGCEVQTIEGIGAGAGLDPLLRGVNVGGVNLKMAEVAEALTTAGFTNVATVLASGNVVLDSAAKMATVRSKAEAALRDAFGYDAWVLAYAHDAVRAISEAFPFEREVDGHHSYVTFVTDAEVLDELAALAGDAGPDEKIERGEGVVYWQVPKGATLDTTMGKTMGKKRYKSSTTTRNLRTIEKVLAK